MNDTLFNTGPLNTRLSVPIVPNISASTVHTFRSTADLKEYKRREIAGDTGDLVEYSRYKNSLELIVEDRLAKLDRAPAAALFPSGMAAVSFALLGLHKRLVPGDEIIISAETYRQTRNFCDTFLSRMGLTVKKLTVDSFTDLKDHISDKTKAVFIESPSNPYLRVLDIEAIAKLKQLHPFILLVDATFASPRNQKPFVLGADLVIHSVTKYLAGHNDLLAGVVCGREDLVKEIKETRGMIGPVLAPELAFRVHQYLQDFPLRMDRHNSNGLAVAQALEKHPAVEKVWYPGLASHPDYETACRTMTAFGGVISFTVRGSLQTAANVIDNCKVARNGPSFGSPITLIEQPALMSHAHLNSQQRTEIGCPDNLIRLAVGLEDSDEIIGDLATALSLALELERAAS